MSGIDWTDAELDALAAYRHAESHEDARAAELALGALVGARVRQVEVEAEARRVSGLQRVYLPRIGGLKEDVAERDETIARVKGLLAEYERMCDPAPYTSERAFVERLRAVLGPKPQPRRCGACRDLSDTHVEGCDGTWGR